MRKLFLCSALSAAMLIMTACSNESSDSVSETVRASKNTSGEATTEQSKTDLKKNKEVDANVEVFDENTVSYTEKHLINEDGLNIYLKVPDPFEVRRMSYDETKVRKVAKLEYKEYSLSDYRYLKVYFDGEITYDPNNTKGSIEYTMALCNEEGKRIRNDTIAIRDVNEGEKFTSTVEFSIPSEGNYTIEFVDKD